MVKLKHFIITQFNLRLWSKDKLNRSTATEEWLANRFILFEKYCLPSVSNQTNKDFVWICLLDENTPRQYVDKIDSYRKDCPQLHPYYLNGEETAEWLNYTKEIIKQNLNADDEYVITTNLDNDDAIHSQMIETIHSKIQNDISEKDELLYSFNIGYQYFTNLGLILRMSYPHNHFLSLVERSAADIKTIKCMPHAKARKCFYTIDIKGEPFWIEFVHKSNVNNDLRITSRIKYYPVFKSISLNNFGLDITLNPSNNFIRFFTKFPMLFTQTAARKLKKKLRKGE